MCDLCTVTVILYSKSTLWKPPADFFYVIFCSIYPSPDQGSTTTSILISNNTGSLPDLANLNFPSPLMSPLDAEGASTQQCSSQDSGILENYISPTMNIALQLYQQQMSKQQQQQGLPMASAGIQRHMVPAPLVLHGSNSFLMGGNTVLAQVGGASICDWCCM